MREIPRLATDDVVRRILSGAQTQDRRPLFLDWTGFPRRTPVPTDWRLYVDGGGVIRNAYGDMITRGPAAGDEHWIREAWAPERLEEHAFSSTWAWSSSIRYRADGALWAYEDARAGRPWRVLPGLRDVLRWHPSIHMPRWACRVVKPIVRPFVERVQEITEAGAMAEGIQRWTKDGVLWKYGMVEPGERGAIPWQDMPRTARDAFRICIWEPLYPGSWERNDWVSGVEWAIAGEVKHG